MSCHQTLVKRNVRKRDQEDVERILSSFNSGLLTNPFVVPEDQDLSEKVSLSNITAGIVLPEDAADCLVDATEIGKHSMEGFITTRIINYRNYKQIHTHFSYRLNDKIRS